MALISTTTTDNIGAPSGQFVAVSFTGVNLRASHTIMARVKNGSTATNYHSVALSYIAQADLTGSFVGRTSGATSTGHNWTRQAPWFSYTRDSSTYSTCYGNTSSWYHLALVYNASTQQIRAYIDGTYIGQTSSSTTRPSNTTAVQFVVGGHNGKFADAAMFDRALSDGEVATMAAYRVPQVTSGLEVFWRLDSDATDTSGNGRTGAVGGSSPNVSWSTADNPPQPETPAVAMSGTASSSTGFVGAIAVTKPMSGTMTSSSGMTGASRARLNPSAMASSSGMTGAMPWQVAGTASSSTGLTAWIRPRWGRRVVETAGDALHRFQSAFPISSPWTAMVWVKPIYVPDGTVGEFAAYAGVSTSAHIFIGRAAGQLRLEFLLNITSAPAVSFNYNLSDSDWHHVAMTYDGTALRCFVDGIQEHSATASPTTTVSYILLDASDIAVVEFAHAKIWGGAALSATDIASEAQFYTPHHYDAQLWSWWQLSWQNVTLDSSGNGQTLTDNGSLEAQNESPGLPFTNLAAVTMASSSGLAAATLAQNFALAGTAASSSGWSAATLAQNFALSGSAASGSGWSAAALTQTLAFVGLDMGSESEWISAALAVAQELSGVDMDSESAWPAAALALAHDLTGADLSSASEWLAAELLSTRELTGTASSSSEWPVVALAVEYALSGSTDSTSGLFGNLGVTGVFSGLATTQSELELAALAVERALNGDVTTSSQFTAALQVLLSGQLDSASALAGAMSTLFGTLATSSAWGATLGVTKPLAGTAVTTSALAAAVLRCALSGSTASSTGFSPAVMLVSASVALTGTTMVTSSGFSGTMTGGSPPSGGGAGGEVARDRVGIAAGVGRRRVR